jgi:dethiobiotin synthetase
LRRSFFITGTDTGVGKTVLVSRLLRGLRHAGVRAVGYKPICCGDRADAELLRAESAAGVTIDEVNPFWFEHPVAPSVAAKLEDRPYAETERVVTGLHHLTENHEVVLVEGVGGWLVPIAPHFFVADLAAKLVLPVFLVVANRLGCLNHTVLTWRSILAAGCTCEAVVLNDVGTSTDEVARQTNAECLRELVPARLLEMPFSVQLDPVWMDLFELRRHPADGGASNVANATQVSRF